MHDKLKSGELWAGYFFYRMAYFGNSNSRDLSPVVVAGRLLGVAMIAGATVYDVERRGVIGGVGGLAACIGMATVGYQVIDKASGFVDVLAGSGTTPATDQPYWRCRVGAKNVKSHGHVAQGGQFVRTE
nr:hypothetical protein [Pseudomonas sp.]